MKVAGENALQPFLNIFNHAIPSYSIMIISGFIVANFLALFSLKRNQYCIEDFILAEAYMILGAMLGSKVLYLWVSRKDIQWELFFTLEYFSRLMRGGFVFYGGLIGGFLGLRAAGRFHKINLKPYLHEFIYLLPFVHGFGRIGCFLAGCCYGRNYNGILQVTFPPGSFAPAGIPLFPVQLIEAAGLFVLSLLLFLLKKHVNLPVPIYVYFLVYPTFRFFLEFFRNDERGRLGPFSTSQWISLCFILFSCSTLIHKRINKNG